LQKAVNIAILVLIVLAVQLNSQTKKKQSGLWLLSAGMGIQYSASPSFTEYLRNEIPGVTYDSIKTYSAGVEFFGGIEYTLNKNVSAKLDYSYYLRSSRYVFSPYAYDFTVTAHQPYLMMYYLHTQSNFRFKLGAGAGYHLGMLDFNESPYGQRTYKAGAFSFRGEFIFAPLFSDKVETYLSGFVFGTAGQKLKDDNGNILKSTTGKEVDLGGYGVGARLGLAFHLN
jgi:hypothetical protein